VPPPSDGRVPASPVSAEESGRSHRAVFFDVENASRSQHIALMLVHLGLPAGRNTHIAAVGNWRVVGLEAARLFSRVGAALVHSAPAFGVKDWSDLRIAVAAGLWLGSSRPGDSLVIVSDDQAFDAVGDVAATRGVVFQRLSLRAIAMAGRTALPKTATGKRRRAAPGRGNNRRRGRDPGARRRKTSAADTHR
jgi:hypothetical protein